MTFVGWLSAELAELCFAVEWNLWEMERQDTTQLEDFSRPRGKDLDRFMLPSFRSHLR